MFGSPKEGLFAVFCAFVRFLSQHLRTASFTAVVGRCDVTVTVRGRAQVILCSRAAVGLRLRYIHYIGVGVGVGSFVI